MTHPHTGFAGGFLAALGMTDTWDATGRHVVALVERSVHGHLNG
jgi:hypothetical protein